MIWDHTITSQTLTYIVTHDALRCAKVVLEGKEPLLNWRHANPNCMNPFGYFPLHEAAEKFSVDMIKLLFRHGASANVRTVGEEVVEDLLPLHVAVENACMHKYLEDNLSPNQDPLDYMYNLIHLLCLPEMIFLDTIRLLAKETDNLVDELWNYIKKIRLPQTAILLLAAHEQIRGDSSSKKNVNCKQNGFPVIMNHIVEQLSSSNMKGENENTQEQLEERMKLAEAFRLVNIISEAGEDLNKYIQAHSEATHVEVLKHVSSILKDHGFCPTGEGIDVRNLYGFFGIVSTFKYTIPYACKISDRELYARGLF
ncbi:hypothetical protein PR202_ga15379 [Eleusine coracana subsp. coracana]|uniref:Uncharacterized protein n=1 Tax=Eleusine coracana subsp. coracana TaxID=191504 RepID=A0AAV5CK13_ELECO|nr:hypothetical protein PR202_ga15379 [Eleusine coracana subsp. coracana]